MRHSAFFRMEEALANSYLMTDLIRRIKERLGQLSDERGRPLQLAVRVPPTLADARRIGLDVEEWITTGLVDIVVVGGGFISFATPVDEFVRAVTDTSCLVYGCIEATRHIDRHFLRALALRWLSDGADGIYLYNFYTMSPEWNRQTAAELSDLETLKRLDKCYEISGTMPFCPIEGHSAAFRYAHPSTQVPVPLPAERPNLGPTLQIRIADHPTGVSASLALRLDHLPPQDRLEVLLNGHPLNWDQARISTRGWTRQKITPLFWASYPTYPVEEQIEGTSVEFEIDADFLRQGINEIAVRRSANQTSERERVMLNGVELSISPAG